MGHKINPISFRLIQNKGWKSKWFNETHHGVLLLEDIELKNTIMKSLKKIGGLEKIEISRNPQEIVVSIYSSRPGMIIGRSGAGVSDLKKNLEEKIKIYRANLAYYLKQIMIGKNLPNKVKLDIIEVQTPEISASLVAQAVANQLERRVAYRRAVHQAIEKAVERGAKGVKIGVAGRLGGVEIARREKFSKGSIPLATIKADIDYSQNNAYTTFGVIGVKVWIYKGIKTKIKDEK